MSAKEYEKHSDDIMEAIRNGKFIYDVSIQHDKGVDKQIIVYNYTWW